MNVAARAAALAALAAGLAAGAAAGTARAAEGALAGRAVPPPLPWQEPAPVARLFLQLPFEAPEPLPERALELGVRLLYSNSLLSGQSDRLTLDVHVETAQPTAWLRYGLAPGVEAELAVPFVADYGGFLDRPIEVVEGWFAFSNPQRQGRPRNVAHFQLTGPGGGGILRDGPGAGLGDVRAALKVKLAGAPESGGSLAVRGAAKLPTGRLPYGSEELDLGASVLAAWCWSATAARLQLDLLVPTAGLPEVHLRTHAYGAVDLGLTHRMGERVALQLQGSGHLSPLVATGLDQLDAATAYVLAGVTVAVARAVELEAAVVENVFSPYRGADITFLLGVKSAP